MPVPGSCPLGLSQTGLLGLLSSARISTTSHSFGSKKTKSQSALPNSIIKEIYPTKPDFHKEFGVQSLSTLYGFSSRGPSCSPSLLGLFPSTKLFLLPPFANAALIVYFMKLPNLPLCWAITLLPLRAGLRFACFCFLRCLRFAKPRHTKRTLRRVQFHVSQSIIARGFISQAYLLLAD